jgi:hypothetical protein
VRIFDQNSISKNLIEKREIGLIITMIIIKIIGIIMPLFVIWGSS